MPSSADPRRLAAPAERVRDDIGADDRGNGLGAGERPLGEAGDEARRREARRDEVRRDRPRDGGVLALARLLALALAGCAASSSTATQQTTNPSPVSQPRAQAPFALAPAPVAPACEAVAATCDPAVTDAAVMAVVGDHCLPCHADSGPAEHPFPYAAALADAPILDRVGTCSMPPDGAPHLSLADRGLVLAWVACHQHH